MSQINQDGTAGHGASKGKANKQKSSKSKKNALKSRVDSELRNDIESELEDLAEIKLRASPKKQAQAVDAE